MDPFRDPLNIEPSFRQDFHDYVGLLVRRWVCLSEYREDVSYHQDVLSPMTGSLQHGKVNG